jgi:hypothetical protein
MANSSRLHSDEQARDKVLSRLSPFHTIFIFKKKTTRDDDEEEESEKNSFG